MPGISISTSEIWQERTSRFYLRVSGPIHSRVFKINGKANRIVIYLPIISMLGKTNLHQGIEKLT